MKILYVTYCCREKNKGVFPPQQLYKSERIKRFVDHCEAVNVNWAILSALYGFFFPDEKKQDYDVTFRTDKNYWLGIAVIRGGVKLSFEESRRHIERLRHKLLAQTASRNIDGIVFYAPAPQRARCYLATLHYAFDDCDTKHKSKELMAHLEKSKMIKVVKSLNHIP